jgi:hypothetical protein
MRDLHNPTSAVNALNATTIATNTNTDGPTVDLQGFETVELVARTGAWTDGAYALQVLESDASGSGFAVAAASAVLGGAPSIGAANTLARLGYIGSKRYIRLRVVSTGTATGASLSAVAVLARQRHTGGKAV